MQGSSIYNIEYCDSFLDTLAAGILDRWGDDPLTLSHSLVLLPNRRSCRVLHEIFHKQCDASSLLLPTIHAIGDPDEMGLMLSAAEAYTSLPAKISSVHRQLLLAKLITQYQSINIEQAAHLALALSNLLDEIQREQLSLDTLIDIVPAELTQHWEITVSFLHILSKQWPEMLKQKNLLDPFEHRNRLLALQAEIWKRQWPEFPIIAAGSTGSIAATNTLLQVIAQLPNGMVVLPGLDTQLDDESWKVLEPTHPQYGIKTLLGDLNISRKDVDSWHTRTPTSNIVNNLISEIFRPSQTINQWKELRFSSDVAKHITLIEAEDIRQEATAIALIMRHTLEDPEKTAALVTHNRGLARYVSSILRRWDIHIDDSAGVALSQTSMASFLFFLIEGVTSQLAPVQLLAALKHPLASGKQSPDLFKQQVQALELSVLRGMRLEGGFQNIIEALNNKKQGDLSNWVNTIHRMFASFIDVMSRPSCNLSTIVNAHLELATALSETDKMSGKERLWSDQAGQEMKIFFDELLAVADSMGEIDPQCYHGLLHALLHGRSFRLRYGVHPRLSILSPMEARLQYHDVMLLGELNQGSWPSQTVNPWMSEPMRQEYGLPVSAQSLGHAAHDLASFLCAPEVIVLRAQKVDTVPTVPSPWLLRLKAVLAASGIENACNVDQAKKYLYWAKQLSMPEQKKSYTAPKPKPPLASRPKQLSVTQIEGLIRDPYSIYASQILDLQPIPPIDDMPSVATFGNMIHTIFETFVMECNQGEYEDIIRIGKHVFAEYLHQHMIMNVWWPRFEQIARSFWQKYKNETYVKERFVEIRGKVSWETSSGEFTLTTRVDRIDTYTDNSIVIIDYKTGQLPKQIDIDQGASPQLSLEGWLAWQGGFKEICPNEIALSYWQLLSYSDEVIEKHVVFSKERTEEGIKALIAHFDQQETPYLSCPNPRIAPRYNDYEHLARIKEWAA